MQILGSLTFALGLFALPVAAKEISIGDVSDLRAATKAAAPGDVLVMREGEWKDASLDFVCDGTRDAPITLRASAPGQTVLTGISTLRFGGQYLVVEGLLFKNPSPSVSDLIEFRKDSEKLASHCRLTNCAIVSELPAKNSESSHWLGLYGYQNRIDHCSIEGKSGEGATCVVWLNKDAKTPQGQHRIDHNDFGSREKLGKNGGETIRVGDSGTSHIDARCIVEQNLFKQCNGEAECISNKSCKNVYRENVFVEVSGTLTLRHGNECLVERNSFFGNGANGTGGIRVIGEDHIVRDNYLEKLDGTDARSAICLMMGIPNSPVNRYFQVRGAVIERNTIVDCVCPILIGLSDDKSATLPPVHTVFVENRVSSAKGPLVDYRCSLDGIEWTRNQFAGPIKNLPSLQGQRVDTINGGPQKVDRAERVSQLNSGVSWSMAITKSPNVK